MKQSELTEGGILRPLLELALPFMVGHVFSTATLFIDRFWVGRVGTEAMAALGTAHVSIMVFYTLTMGMAIGTLAGVARSIGARDPERAGRFFGQGLLIEAALGLGLACLAWTLPPLIIEFMGAGAGAAQPAQDYLQIMMWGLAVHGPLVAVTFSLQGAGEAQAALKVAVVAPVVNAALDPLFIFTLGLGMPGAAWATVCATVVALAVGLQMVARGDLRLRATRDAFRPRLDIARSVVVVGLPGSLEHTVRTVASFSLVKILNGFGDVIVAAYTTVMLVVMMLIFPGLALGQATASLVGQNLGAGRPRRAWRTAWAGAGIYAAFMIVLGAAAALFGGDVTRLFLPGDLAAEAEGRQILQIFALSFPFIALALVLSKAFGGAGTTVPPMIAAFLAHVVLQIPAAYWLGQLYGPAGAYWAMSAAFVVHGLLSAVLFIRRFAPQR